MIKLADVTLGVCLPVHATCMNLCAHHHYLLLTSHVIAVVAMTTNQPIWAAFPNSIAGLIDASKRFQHYDLLMRLLGNAAVISFSRHSGLCSSLLRKRLAGLDEIRQRGT